MNKKVLTIILAIALIAGFFLPISSAGSGSAFDVVQAAYPVSGVEAILMKYIWILVPVSGILLLIGALNNSQYAPARAVWAILPFLAIAYIIIRPVMEGFKIGDMVKGFGIGFWVMLGASLILAVYHPKK